MAQGQHDWCLYKKRLGLTHTEGRPLRTREDAVSSPQAGGEASKPDPGLPPCEDTANDSARGPGRGLIRHPTCQGLDLGCVQTVRNEFLLCGRAPLPPGCGIVTAA